MSHIGSPLVPFPGVRIAAGNLNHALNGLAEYYEQEAAKAVGAATELIQPAVILLVAGLVGFVGTAVISGIYSAISSIE